MLKLIILILTRNSEEHSDMKEKVCSLVLNKFAPITKIYADGSQPGFIRSLKIALNEDPEYEKAIEYYNHNHMDWQANMMVLPIPFSTSHKAMLSHTRTLIEDGVVVIHPTRFQKGETQTFHCEEEGLTTGLCIFHDEKYYAYRRDEFLKRFIEKINDSISKEQRLICVGYNLDMSDKYNTKQDYHGSR